MAHFKNVQTNIVRQFLSNLLIGLLGCRACDQMLCNVTACSEK